MPKSTDYIAKQPDAQGLIHYNADENAVWSDLMTQQLPNVRKYAAEDYLQGLDQLDMPTDRVPQCVDISAKLHPVTGWRVAPVPALIGFKTFFEMLANKTFPAASFIRNRRDFDYIEEPDIFHEIFGHTPLLTDERFARFSQKIGETGCGCEAKDYAWLIRLYWFTIEFGLKAENGVIKALGSGLASSPTELPYAVTDEVPDRRPFDVIDILRTPYRIDIPQPLYYVLDNVDDLFAAADRDLLNDIHTAQSLGLFTPTYPLKDAS